MAVTAPPRPELASGDDSGDASFWERTGPMLDAIGAPVIIEHDRTQTELMDASLRAGQLATGREAYLILNRERNDPMGRYLGGTGITRGLT